LDKIVIRPSWTFTTASGKRVDPRLFDLLGAIHESGKLTLAAERIDLSYRHAWDLIAKWSAFFGSPLVRMARGKGAWLAPLGEKLLWAEHRSDASLFPLLENIASELNLEINRHLKPAQALLRIHASHGYAVEKIPRVMREHGQADVDLQYMGSVDALRSLGRGACEFAGFHMPEGELAAVLRAHYEPVVKPRLQAVIRLVKRTQGLVVARGNPLHIRGMADLARPGLRFVNRQRGSGTRVLLDGMLAAARIDPRHIPGYAETGEFTHAAVAAFVASHMADVGVAVEPAARQFKLGFIPLVVERYMLACDKRTLELPAAREMLSLLRGDAFREAVSGEPGYTLDEPGLVVPLAQALELPGRRGGIKGTLPFNSHKK
jgi:molybdate transport repressor ModE-like protein